MLINGCHGKTEDAEEKIVPLNEVSDKTHNCFRR